MMRGTKYIWQQEGWPHMQWDDTSFSNILAEINLLRGKLLGRVSMFGFEEQNLSMLESMTQEIVHSAKIEGEELNRDSVRSSVARQLGLEYEGLKNSDHYTEGVVQVMIDAVQHHDMPLDVERLFSWHAALFPTGRSGIHKILVGDWRQGEEPMQVVSGPLGHEKIHYEAPASKDVPDMMSDFLRWFDSENTLDPLVKTAVMHLWFVTIHPFDDGNGRICRTLTELLLSRADQTSQRYYSLSSEILNHRKDYYQYLEQAQKGGLDVTPWIRWFLQTLKLALEAAFEKTEGVLRKSRFHSERIGYVVVSSFKNFFSLKNREKRKKYRDTSENIRNSEVTGFFFVLLHVKIKSGAYGIEILNQLYRDNLLVNHSDELASLQGI